MSASWARAFQPVDHHIVGCASADPRERRRRIIARRNAILDLLAAGDRARRVLAAVGVADLDRHHHLGVGPKDPEGVAERHVHERRDVERLVAGLAHHRRNVIPEGQKPQPSALNHAQDEPVVQGSDWVMVFDADEFLSIRYGEGTVDGLLDAAVAQDANGVVVTALKGK